MTNGENRRVPDVAYRVFNKSFENPSLDEGFAEVITVPFIPVFDNPKAKELFQQWTG